MSIRLRFPVTFLLLWLAGATLFAQESRQADTPLFRSLRAMSRVVAVKSIKVDSTFSEGVEVLFSQPLDHLRPDGERFTQRVYISHAGDDRPVVLFIEGYAANRNSSSEPTRLLRGNQVFVEHRFFGVSRPDSLKWEYLTVKQSAEDLHDIVTALKTIYRGKWVSTGVSKGGQTTLLYRFFYPGDVDASIPYVAPINIAQEDPRPTQFLRTVGDDSCRQKIRAVQVALLKNEDRILGLLEKHAREKKYLFSLGMQRMYEFAVLEYPFSFWQYGRPGRCATIPPPESAPETLFDHLVDVVPLSMYADEGIRFFQPFIYQAYTEMGYYTYDITDFAGLLKVVSDPSNRIFAPPAAPLVYRCEVFQEINRWLRYEGSNIIYIYGEDDPWTACSVQLAGTSNAIKMVKKHGSHRTKIRDLAPEQQQVVYDALERWVGVKIGK